MDAVGKCSQWAAHWHLPFPAAGVWRGELGWVSAGLGALWLASDAISALLFGRSCSCLNLHGTDLLRILARRTEYNLSARSVSIQQSSIQRTGVVTISILYAVRSEPWSKIGPSPARKAHRLKRSSIRAGFADSSRDWSPADAGSRLA